MNRFILIGARSVGKTTIGKVLAKKLKIRFYDLDDIVDKDLHGLDGYIKRYGVKKYRYIEHEILKEFVRTLPENFVLSLGGGTIASQYKSLSRKNQGILKSLGKIIYLRPAISKKDSIKILYANELKRKGDKSLKEIIKLHGLREHIYENICDKKIILKDKSMVRIIDEMIRA